MTGCQNFGPCPFLFREPPSVHRAKVALRRPAACVGGDAPHGRKWKAAAVDQDDLRRAEVYDPRELHHPVRVRRFFLRNDRCEAHLHRGVRGNRAVIRRDHR